MKKLLNELEAKKNSYNQSGDYATGKIQGLMIAMGIVRAHNPWIDAGSELPPFESEWSVMSEIVLLKDEDGEIYRGYYTLETDTYKTKSGFTIIPTHWAYLPEVKP